ncbi:flavodoxin family protein [Anaerosinus massiliensis]|uniref:flavodoxin family protein n=1 Tax=Massilibacillus massiliensis TaxID=1806837 RepID=UPI000AD8684C|nr:flavodoxin family protein [Massilibacillus massiliensis]
MNCIVLYSSRTGNTEKIAKEICSVLPNETPCLSVADAPENLDAYDCVFVGFWVDRGTADAQSKKLLERLHHPKVALFATLGADPDSEHATSSMQNAIALLPSNAMPIHTFICQGKVDPNLIEQMKKMFPTGHPHAVTSEREKLHERASVHPDDRDLQAARNFVVETLKRLENSAL